MIYKDKIQALLKGCEKMKVKTRIAPSPTGYMHIGTARGALYNYLYAKHMGGEFALRIEDTDMERSTPESTKSIINGLKWLGIDWDGEVVFQSERAGRHIEVAKKLLEMGKAYYCYATPEELTQMREEQKQKGLPQKYDRRWRDKSPDDAPSGIPPVVRIKAPLNGKMIVDDLIQGRVEVDCAELDDFIILRSDGTPTYMLSVVVDDNDMEITHIIRGSEHLNNAFRQKVIIEAMGWQQPIYAHVPLIHGSDGTKLSKRHGAVAAESYKDMGFLPEAMCNYILKLGWGHGDDEIISREQAIEWFDIAHVGKGPARFDVAKLTAINAHYIKNKDDAELADLVLPFLQKKLSFDLNEAQRKMLFQAMPDLKERAKTLIELAEMACFYFEAQPIKIKNEKAAKILSEDGKKNLKTLIDILEKENTWEACVLEEALKKYCNEQNLKMGDYAQPARAAITGSNVSPPIFKAIEILGRQEALSRLKDKV